MKYVSIFFSIYDAKPIYFLSNVFKNQVDF